MAKKTFVVPQKKYEAEIFDCKEIEWRTEVIKAPSPEEALRKIYVIMNDNDILLKVRNEGGYLI